MGTLYFPNLDLSFKLNETMLHIGPLEIKWYGAIIAVGFLLAFIYTYRRIDKFGLAQNDFLDVLIGAVVGGVVGARLYYVIFSWDYYSQNLGAIFNIRGGGLAIYGGIIGGFLVALLMCKIKKIKFLPFADLAVGGLFIGQAIGRWGNFVNMEAFGTNTDLPWGMTSARIQTYLSSHLEELTRNGMDIHPMEPVHPTFLYESLVCVIGFLILFFYLKHRRFDGELLLIYSAWYGLGRCLIEGMRTDSLMLGSVRISQILAAVFALTAIVIWIVIRVKIKKKNDPEYLKLYVNTEASIERRAADKAGRKKKARSAAASQHADSREIGEQQEEPLSPEQEDAKIQDAAVTEEPIGEADEPSVQGSDGSNDSMTPSEPLPEEAARENPADSFPENNPAETTDETSEEDEGDIDLIKQKLDEMSKSVKNPNEQEEEQ